MALNEEQEKSRIREGLCNGISFVLKDSLIDKTSRKILVIAIFKSALRQMHHYLFETESDYENMKNNARYVSIPLESHS